MPFVPKDGSVGFIKGRYIVSPTGLDGEDPNPVATREGGRALEQLSSFSNNKNSTFYKFITFLKTIQKQEEAKEKNYLIKKISYLKQQQIDSEYLPLIEDRINAEDYSGAYTLLQKRGYDLERFLKEAKKSNFSPTRSTEFFEKQFSKFLEDFLSDKIVSDGDKLTSLIIKDTNITIDSIIEDYFQKTFNQGTVIGIEHIKNQYKKELLEFFKRYKLANQNSTINSLLFKTKKNVSPKITKKGLLTEKHQRIRSVKTLLKGIGSDIVKGISTELLGASKLGQNGNGLVFSTGGHYKTTHGGKQTVQIKDDYKGIEIYSATFDTTAVVQELRDEFGELSNAEEYQLLLNKVEKYLNDSTEIFEITVNTKGYISKRDLQIEGEGNFQNRMDNLQEIINSSPDVPNNAIDKLLFLMNNLISGAIAQGQEHLISTYIGAICAGYIWDDYTNIFKTGSANGIQVIHLFQSGTGFFTLSQMMQETIYILESQAKNSFVDVQVKGANINLESAYVSVKESHSLDNAETGHDIPGILQARWDDIRNLGLEGGTMSIHFRQQELEKLLNNLTGALRSV